MKKFIVAFLLMMAAGVFLYQVANKGFFPLAIVNSKIITAKLFRDEYAAAYKYYSTALKTYNDDSLSVAASGATEFKRELKRAVLDKIVEDALVYGSLKQIIGKDLTEIVDNKIKDKVDSENLKEAALTLYGLNLSDFEKLVLVPQAHREILAGRLYLEKQNLSEWLEKIRTNASVIVLMPDLSWNNGRVEVRSSR